MATLFHNSSLLGFVPLEVLVHRGCGTAHQNAESESRVRGGPALFITKLTRKSSVKTHPALLYGS